MSNAWLRILTALVGIPLVLGVTYVGGLWFVLLIGVGALLAQWEVYRMFEQGGQQPWKVAGLVLGGLVALRAVWPWAEPMALVGALALVAACVFVSTDRPLADLSATIFGVLYPTVFLTTMVDLRLARGPLVGPMEAFFLTLAVFILIWATDTLAYYVGKSLGRHKLAPSVSPKKTWEGSVGGALGALLAGVLLKLTWLSFLAWPHVLALALIGGVVSQLGDLAESRFKRSVDVKDSGTILPGHGGLLDRFDALILTAPLFYLYLAYVARLFGVG